MKLSMRGMLRVVVYIACGWALLHVVAHRSYGQGGPEGGAVRALTIDPSSPTTLYAGTASDGGVYKSTNGGVSWTAVNSGLSSTTVLALAIDRSMPAILYAGTSGGGVFKSTNGG